MIILRALLVLKAKQQANDGQFSLQVVFVVREFIKNDEECNFISGPNESVERRFAV